MEWVGWESPPPRTLVRSATGEAALWIDGDGDLRDVLGEVRVYDGGCRAADLEAGELVVFVAEWLMCVVEREGPRALTNVHPELRVLAYELTPSAFDVTDDDALDVLR